LTGLQKNIGAHLTPLGFPPEARPFTPHLTIGRVKDFARPEERAAIGQMITRTDYSVKYKVDVTAVNLMKSQLTREGPIYSKLASVTLK
jgi:RNA 2',3'-cyclic 3'-phosphodiesterase